MHAALLSLLLTAALVSVPGECAVDGERRRQQGRFGSRLEEPAAGAGAGAGAAAAGAAVGRFYLERSGPLMRKGIHHAHSLVVLPLRSAGSDAALLFDLRRRWFLCMDLSGELYISRLTDEDDCLFRRAWSDVARKRQVLYSAGGGRLLRLKAAQRRAARRKPAQTSRTVAETFSGPSAGRKRRSQEVNPSDPLRSQSHPSHPVREHRVVEQPEQDQAGAVSKETITSCDDPLRVLRPNAPGSPVKTNIADRAEHD